MKIVVQNFKTGHLSVADMPPPTVRRGGVLVENTTSLISAGTDRAIIAMAKKNPLGKAQDRPDLAKQVLAKVRTEGFWNTYKMVNNLIAEPIPLGYSCAGRVIAVGEGVTGFGVGDRVACAGLGYANHAEVVFVPKNLAVKIPEGVGDEQAAYATLGAIALQGLRQAQLQMGSTVAVIGLGLVGLLTVQMAKASGFRVIGVDVDPAKNDLAVTLGADAACPPKSGELKAAVDRYTSGFGVDSVLVCAASKKSNETVVLAAELCRDRGSVVAVGDVNLDIPRREYFTKEIDVKLSRSYGPGRYDPAYEEQGHDYPIGYVRWTENRNMQAFLDQVAMGHFDPTALTTQDFPIERGEEAYQLVTDPPEGAFTVGIVLRYKADGSGRIARMDHAPKVRGQNAPVRLGVVGAGMFAKGILLPAFMAQKDVAMVGVATASGISAKSVAEKYGAAFSSSDAQEVIAHADVNTVLIATRHDTHGRYVLAALQAGKHVYVEKPPALNEEELAAIEQVWRGASADGGAPVLAVGYNRRFSPLAKTLKSAFGETHGPLSITYRVNAGRIDPKDKSG